MNFAARARSLSRFGSAGFHGVPFRHIPVSPGTKAQAEAALVDLACLSNGFVDFPLPANAVAEQIVYMLKHSRARVLLCSDEEQVAKVLPSLSGLPDLRERALALLDQVGMRADADRPGFDVAAFWARSGAAAAFAPPLISVDKAIFAKPK